ncbi:MAG: RNA polymerase-binding protein RbpA [Bifidobacteriaceae bacterium]|jgi:hypothetical protein|nr:RNA polymerase-binding protein RbpA [Bifidobacteriaceae bacterium]
MAERSLRGSGIGFQSLESEEGVEFAERQEVAYDCPCGNSTILPFALEAEPPALWQCRCGLNAVLRGAAPLFPEPRHQRTHWEMLLERRSVDQLEDLLEEYLGLLRSRRAERAPVAV